jgi:hypothetical protein
VAVFGGQNFGEPMTKDLVAQAWHTGGYHVTIPADKGVAVPGYWMLVALDSSGVPSVSKVIRIG